MQSLHGARLGFTASLLGLTVAGTWLPSRAMAQGQGDTPAATQPTGGKETSTESEGPRHVRVVESKGKSIALEISSREFTPPDGKGPRVCLVGVAHIADRSFYRAVEKLLDQYDIVLYESVKPAGTGGAGGETDEERIESTKAAMQFVGGVIEAYKSKNESSPESIAALRVFAVEREPRLGPWLDIAMIDGWGKTLQFTRNEDAGECTLISLGADGAIGGEGAASDISLADQHPPDPLKLNSEDNLQTQLADALGLEFQLDAIDYSHGNWRCSDMAIDQVNRAMEVRGADFGPLSGTLAGSSFPAKLIKMMLGLMRMADSMLGGALADTFKVVMIEMLGDEAFIEKGLGQLGEGFTEVIVEQRNQVAVDDLKKIIGHEPEVKSVAILYGAAHMDDLADRLVDQLHYTPGETQWLRAVEVDLEESAVTARDLNQIRTMMKQMMRAQQK